MSSKSESALGIGVVGCGSISHQYMRNARLFGGVRLVACTDLSQSLAEERAAEYGIVATSMEGLLAHPEVDIVLNLTIPAAHYDVSMAALTANKHVFTEKPLATSAALGRKLVEEAEARNLQIGSAPDTFLGAAGRRARALIEDGAIGRPVSGTAFMFGRGMEHWHPNPAFYYQPGAGPVFDMGPYYLTSLVNLLGPVKSVVALSSKGQDERLITADGPNKNTTFPVGTPTTVLSLLEFASGTSVTFGASWDVFRHSNHSIELHGTKGSLRMPDPDMFGGVVGLSSMGSDWAEYDTAQDLFGALNYPAHAPDKANYRMVGLADFASAIREGRAPRASGRLALHVLDVMEAILTSGETRSIIPLDGTVAQPLLLGEAEAKSLLVEETV